MWLRAIRTLATTVLCVVVVLAAGCARAQSTAPPVRLLTPPELDQLLAPIALYPDPLLSQILMAATYPEEVAEAARWLRDPGDAALQGEQLAAALEQQDWDPSVKSLVPFPDVLQMMAQRPDWTLAIGQAFLAQPADVMASIQGLRRMAEAAGTLASTPQATVMNEGGMILIEPPAPGVVYVPVYDPWVVFAPWPYPGYPPLYFPPPPNYIIRTAPYSAIGFSIGVVVVQSLWGWSHWDWHHHRIHIDVHRFNRIDTHRPPVTMDIWHHRSHRRPFRGPRRFHGGEAPAPHFERRGPRTAPHQRFRAPERRGGTRQAAPPPTFGPRPARPPGIGHAPRRAGGGRASAPPRLRQQPPSRPVPRVGHPGPREYGEPGGQPRRRRQREPGGRIPNAGQRLHRSAPRTEPGPNHHRGTYRFRSRQSSPPAQHFQHERRTTPRVQTPGFRGGAGSGPHRHLTSPRPHAQRHVNPRRQRVRPHVQSRPRAESAPARRSRGRRHAHPERRGTEEVPQRR